MSSRVSVTQEEFETLSEQAKAFAVTKETLEKRSKSLIAREQVVSRREALLDSSERLSERNKVLTAQNKTITEEVFQLRKKLSSEKSKNSVLLARIAELTRLKQVEKELNELKARLKDFEFYKNIHDFLKQRTRNFDEFIQQVDRWARKNKEPAQQKQLNRRQNGPER